MNLDGTTRAYFEEQFAPSRQFDEACSQFEQALHRGEPTSLEELVSQVESEARPRLLGELLTREMAFRAKRGETPALEEYKERFPEHHRLVKYLYFEHFMPARIGEFAVQRLLGRGSFGLVYQGWDARLSRSVAIKIFRRHPDDVELSGGHLLREARAAAQLRHPGVVTVYAVMQDDDGDEFLVLEYVDGRSLEDLLRSERLPAEEAVHLLLSVTQALQHAHQNGLVHRDLKPANILLDQGRRPRVTDFGLALDLIAARRSREIAGTLAYMSPEQVNGETHRLDGRTDLWAMGVVLYRMLAGRLPFAGAHREELLNAIRYHEPDDLLRRDPSIPTEVARIVRKCLAKRMSERYQSAAELAEDLSAFLNPAHDHRRDDRGGSDIWISQAPVIPKGLRCFDANDREFFLALVPGPRDRNGVPEEVRFWENHLRELDASRTFRVGLLYGPSGSGKSSLVRAGILPRLHGNVKLVVIEATHAQTEQRLMREIQRLFPDVPADRSLPEMLALVREGTWLQPGEKLLIVIDQFEQWLHGWRQDQAAGLVEMLRQCDGGRVQALVLVRDDFWMPATRFFQQLDVPLVEGSNASAVDLFDPTHARKVLAAFGVAYGQLHPDPVLRGTEQQRFLDRAIAELSVDGRIVPVRLCIFAEMVKSRPWTPNTLREVGGAQGLGTAFLEEVFDSRAASPMHRLHRKAARLVLERLLPPPGTDIRGHLVSESALQAVAGYDQRPDDFEALLHCLDSELRLITPSESERGVAADDGAGAHGSAAERHYQLTHDFLVTAIRGWLNQTRRQSLRGRAELRLAEYADAYRLRPEARQLPTAWEYLGLLVLTPARRWRTAERAMMLRAARHYAWRYGLGLLAVTALAIVIYERMATIHAQGLVQALTTSDSRDVPAVAAQLTSQRSRAVPMLQERIAAEPAGSDQRTRLLLGLAAAGEPRSNELFEQLLSAEPSMAVAIAEVLVHHGDRGDLEPRLWRTASSADAPPDQRLRASVALARSSPAGPAEQWQSIADGTVAIMLRDAAENPGHIGAWFEGFAPASRWLLKPLRASFRDASLAEAERLLATSFLAQFAPSDVDQMVELALEASPKQLDILARSIAKHGDAALPALAREATAPVDAELPEEDKDVLVRRRANAILLLQTIGDDRFLWPALAHRPDPRLRSFLLDYLRQFSRSPSDWARRLAAEPDAGVRQALVLLLGSAAGRNAAAAEHAETAKLLLGMYRDDTDAGVHGALQWTLRRLGHGEQLASADAELAGLGLRDGFGWYVTPSALTMIVFRSPITALLGSPKSEPGRDSSDESQWECTIDWTFAISATEITQRQYRDVCPEYKEYLNEFARTPDCPVNAVTWLDANRFCRLLGQRDGIAEAENVVPRDADLKKPQYPDFRTLRGYRLPTEAEWEVACRAGTATSRFFGHAPDLLGLYCCYIANSGGECSEVASAWPNPAGAFDVLGNIGEWCFDKYEEQPDPSQDIFERARGYSIINKYGVRGNDYSASERMVRTANRRGTRADDLSYSHGFRIAHTIPKRPQTDESSHQAPD